MFHFFSNKKPFSVFFPLPQITITIYKLPIKCLLALLTRCIGCHHKEMPDIHRKYLDFFHQISEYD